MAVYAGVRSSQAAYILLAQLLRTVVIVEVLLKGRHTQAHAMMEEVKRGSTMSAAGREL